MSVVADAAERAASAQRRDARARRNAARDMPQQMPCRDTPVATASAVAIAAPLLPLIAAIA